MLNFNVNNYILILVFECIFYLPRPLLLGCDIVSNVNLNLASIFLELAIGSKKISQSIKSNQSKLVNDSYECNLLHFFLLTVYSRKKKEDNFIYTKVPILKQK